MSNPPTYRAEPDPEFADRLEHLLLQRLTAAAGSRGAQITGAADGSNQEGHITMVDIKDRPMGGELVSPGRRRRGRWLLVAAAAIVVVLAAAGIASRIEDPARVATTPPTTSRADTTTEQYGNVVGEHAAAILEWIEAEESADHVEDAFDQYLRERYVPFRQLLVNFDQALAEVPSPPDEIAALVDRTRTQVKATLNSVDLLLTCTATSSYCFDDERSAAEAAYKGLPPVFEEWSPYT